MLTVENAFGAKKTAEQTKAIALNYITNTYNNKVW